MRQLSLAIVGLRFPNKRGPARRFEAEVCVPGEPIELRPEPKNPADPHAIAVFSCRGIQLGYLTAERAPWIGGMIRNGREITAIYQGLEQHRAWARVAFDGDVPILPPPPDPPERPDDSGFLPDDIWDDQ